MSYTSIQAPEPLAWAVGNPLTEYQKEYYKKRSLRQQHGKRLSTDAGELLQ